MPAFTINATANSAAHDQWTLGAGPSKWQAVSDADDGTWISANNVWRQQFVFENISADARIITPPVTLHVRAKDATLTADLLHTGVDDAGTHTDGAGINLTDSIADYTQDYALCGAKVWTPDLVNSCEYGVNRPVFTSFTMSVYRFYVTGTWLPSSGGFAFLICSLVGGLLGANLMLSDMPGIARAVAQNPRRGEGVSIIQPHEYGRALAELKAHPFRAWSR